MHPKTDSEGLIALTAEIVSAFVISNTLPARTVPSLIGDVFTALARAQSGAVVPPPLEPPSPAVNPKRSITPDFLICLEDGKKFKSLRRHLRASYNLSPEQYRQKWGLSDDYPMVAPNYSEARSRLAKELGLGQKRKQVSRRRSAS